FKRHGSLKLDGCGYIVHCHGVTRHPETQEYMMVMNYSEDGDLRHYVQKNMTTLRWKDAVEMLCNIAMGLLNVHKNGTFHKNLHCGNILKFYSCNIADFGLCGPSNSSEPRDDFVINSTNDFDDVDMFEQTLASRIFHTKCPVIPDIHPFAIYKSRFLLFPNLPSPRNSFSVADPPVTISYLDFNDNSLQSDDEEEEITYEEYNTNYPEFSDIESDNESENEQYIPPPPPISMLRRKSLAPIPLAIN
ncbi:18307_t:CDS:2, partial [Gigaspora rosea]